MDDQEDIKKVVDDFFANATEQDLLELDAFLKSLENKMPGMAGAPGMQSMPNSKSAPSSRNSRQPLGKMDVNKTANRFASDIKQRMGLTSEQITSSARDAVRTMILQYDPYIPEEKIQALLRQWVPDKSKAANKIPNDAMRAMVSQFVAYSMGELTDEQLKSFPQDWAKKYWTFFPEQVQMVVRAYIKDEITKPVFLDLIEKLLGK
ncbi:MAG: hypothetical protein V1874_04440 [Spirochaetota bacterium]